VARIGDGRKLYRVLVRKPEAKRPLGRRSCRWKDGIRRDNREIGWGGVWSRSVLLSIGRSGGLSRMW
jgi:hypothetical protein